MASAVYLWPSSFQKSRAEAHQPNPSFQAHEPMLGISTTSRLIRATPAPASARADALAFPAKRPPHDLGLGLGFMGQIRLLKIFYQLTGTIPSLADQSFHPQSTYSTIDHDTLSYYRSLLIELMASSSSGISPVYTMSEGAGFPVAMAGPRDPSPDSAFPDLFRIPGLEDPSRFPFGPSVTMMSGLLPSQPSEHGSYVWEVYLKLFNGEDLVFGELNRGGRDLMKVAINGSDLPGLNIEKVKAVDEGTSRDFGGKAQWPGSSSGLHVFEKTENNVTKKRGKAAVNRRPKVYNFFPVKKVCGKGKRGGRKPAPLAKAKAIVGPIDFTLKLGL